MLWDTYLALPGETKSKENTGSLIEAFYLSLNHGDCDLS